MSLVSTIIGTAERVPLPDAIIRAAIHRLCSRAATRLAEGSAESDAWLADEMAARAIAEYTGEAGDQHHEMPAAFFAHLLGPNRKCSCCFYKEPASTLQEAEEEALRQTIEHGDLVGGQSILELGCGWGSLALRMARQFPYARITAVSNSDLQREYIEGEAAKRGLTNLHVITSDIVFDASEKFDRIVAVEMFERMMNWRELMTRLRAWLKPDGRFFMHVYTHRSGAPICSIARRRGMDRPALLRRRGDAEPSSDPAIWRSVCGREGMALERNPLSTHRAGLARAVRCPSRRDRDHPAQGPWQRYGLVDAALALVPARDRGSVRLCRRQRMGRQPLSAEGNDLIR
jgi:precorrin-6B methylase 2